MKLNISQWPVPSSGKAGLELGLGLDSGRVLDVWENLGFLGEFWIVGRVLDFWENPGFLGESWISGSPVLLGESLIIGRVLDFWENLEFLDISGLLGESWIARRVLGFWESFGFLGDGAGAPLGLWVLLFGVSSAGSLTPEADAVIWALHHCLCLILCL